MTQPTAAGDNQKRVIFDPNTEHSTFYDVSYDENKYVGSGALGQIYQGEGRRADGSLLDVVVKIPISVDKYDEARAEYEVFAKLRRQVLSDHPGIAVALPEVELARSKKPLFLCWCCLF